MYRIFTVCISLIASFFWLYATSASGLAEGRMYQHDNKEEEETPMFGIRSKLVMVSSSSDSSVTDSVPAYPINSLLTAMLNLGSSDDVIRNPRSTNTYSSDDSLNTLAAVFPIYGNVYPSGLYFVSMRFGNPLQEYFLDMDTGSDLTWLQCDAPCVRCAKGPHPLYKPRQANLVDCSEASWSTIQVGSRFGCDKGFGQCDYDIQYADGGTSLGVLIRDRLALILSNGTWGRTQAIIGCAYNQQGSLAHSPSATDGVLGLSSSSISLPSQLSQKGLMKNVIAHCISGDGSGGGYLLMGDKLLPRWGMTWASFVGKPAMKNYALSMATVFYGDVQVDVNSNAVKTAIFDSGSSYTYLIPSLYTAIVATIQEHLIGSGLQRDKSDSTLPFCWRGNTPIRSLKDVLHVFKPIILEFNGSKIGKTSRMQLSGEGYLINNSRGNVCLGLLDASVMGKDASNIIGGDYSQDFVCLEKIHGFTTGKYENKPHHDYHRSTIRTQLHHNLSFTGNHGRQPQNYHTNVKTIKNHVNLHKASLKLVAEKQKSGFVFKLSFAFDANVPGKFKIYLVTDDELLQQDNRCNSKSKQIKLRESTFHAGFVQEFVDNDLALDDANFEEEGSISSSGKKKMMMVVKAEIDATQLQNLRSGSGSAKEPDSHAIAQITHVRLTTVMVIKNNGQIPKDNDQIPKDNGQIPVNRDPIPMNHGQMDTHNAQKNKRHGQSHVKGGPIHKEDLFLDAVVERQMIVAQAGCDGENEGMMVYEVREIYGGGNLKKPRCAESRDSDGDGDGDGDDCCVVCLGESRDTLLLPCRHMCLCSACAATFTYKHNMATCPLCRQNVQSLIRIHTSN